MESNVGIEWVVDAVGCVPSALRDVRGLQTLVARAIDELGLRVLGTPAWHVFDGQGGVTGLVMLTESHFAVHTYPEVGIATFNLYCCSARPEWPWADRLAEHLGAEAVEVRAFARGGVCEAIGAERIAG
jgi:S-adenosylmethionine decarboxylase